MNVNHPQDTSRTSCLRPMGTMKPLPLKPHPRSHEAPSSGPSVITDSVDVLTSVCKNYRLQLPPDVYSLWILYSRHSSWITPLCCGSTPSECPAFLSMWPHACPFLVPSLCQSGFQDQVTQNTYSLLYFIKLKKVVFFSFQNVHNNQKTSVKSAYNVKFFFLFKESRKISSNPL